MNILKIYGAITTTMLCWGFSYIVTKVALKTFSVSALVLVRFCLAALIFLILLSIKGFPKFAGKDQVKMIITSFFFPFSYYFMETAALHYTSASEASIIAATIPIVVLILSGIFLKEKISIIGAGGIMISFTGIVVLVLGNMNGELNLGSHLTGNIIMLGAVLSAAIYIVLTHELGKKYSSFEITGTQIIYGTLIFIIISIIQFNKISITQIDSIAVASVLFLAILSTVIAFFCYNYALTKIPAAQASIFINGVPVVTAFSAVFILGEALNLIQILGGLSVIFAVTITGTYGN